MEAICATGIRVSEVKHLTVESVQMGRAEVSLKGKIRTILIPRKLARKLLSYARKNKTASGEIFLTGNGKPLSRRQIRAEMKALCKTAGVEATKVFPHQPASLVRRGVLQSLSGYRPSGRCAGALQHRDHQDLSADLGKGTRAGIGKVRADFIKQNQHFVRQST